jgi:segregation and condensation protein A
LLVLESSLTNACKIKIKNFEGPFDLLFHLIEKNQIDIYDIPINEITDQYMDYLFAMKELDLEIASEFLIMASTLLHIKSRLLLPNKSEKQEEEPDPREELVLRLIEYKKYKDICLLLKLREQQWEKVFYKPPEVVEIKPGERVIELSAAELKKVYVDLILKNKRKINRKANEISQIVQHERVSVKSKMKEIVRVLLVKSFFNFSEIFSVKSRTKTELLAGFLAVLELVKLKVATIEQKKLFSDIYVYGIEQNAKKIDEVVKVAGEV